MAIFEEIGKKITQTTQSAVKSTKDMADIARLNTLISDEQKLLNSFYMQIGKKYYEMHNDSPAEEYSELCVSITDCLQRTADLRDNVQQIKGIKKCPGCGAEIPIASTFCGICGFDTRTMQESDGQAKLCTNCNVALADDAAFCTGCGQRV